MFKQINFYEDGFTIRYKNGRYPTSKRLIELAKWVVKNYVKPIETRVKVWNHGKPYTGEIGGADYLMNRLDLYWNDCVMATGINGLIKRAKRDGAMQLIKLLRQNPDLLDHLEIESRNLNH